MDQWSCASFRHSNFSYLLPRRGDSSSGQHPKWAPIDRYFSPPTDQATKLSHLYSSLGDPHAILLRSEGARVHCNIVASAMPAYQHQPNVQATRGSCHLRGMIVSPSHRTPKRSAGCDTPRRSRRLVPPRRHWPRISSQSRGTK
jgi:hypothetical protein